MATGTTSAKTTAEEHWILFDVGNVLVPFQHERIAAALGAAIFRRSGKAEAAEALHRFFFEDREPHGTSFNHLLDTGRIELDAVRAEFNRYFRAQVSEDEFRAAWRGIFDPANAEVTGWIAKVQARGFRVGICSDTNAEHWEILRAICPQLETAGVRHFLSFQSPGHFRKADDGYFKEVAAATGQPPGNHVLIDDRQPNIASARRNGFHAILADAGLNWSAFESFLRAQGWIRGA